MHWLLVATLILWAVAGFVKGLATKHPIEKQAMKKTLETIEKIVEEEVTSDYYVILSSNSRSHQCYQIEHMITRSRRNAKFVSSLSTEPSFPLFDAEGPFLTIFCASSTVEMNHHIQMVRQSYKGEGGIDIEMGLLREIQQDSYPHCWRH
jgi:hypothetical protein